MRRLFTALLVAAGCAAVGYTATHLYRDHRDFHEIRSIIVSTIEAQARALKAEQAKGQGK
jgi:hypothetical protein